MVVTEDRMQDLEARIEVVERRLRLVEAIETRPPERPPLAPRRAPARLGGAAPAIPAAPRTAPAPRAAAPDLEQLLGGRVLAWVGGAAVLVGLALLLALAIANGWLGELARTLLAGAASLGLVAGGIALHERRGRTEAARAAVGAGLAGIFLTLAVATRAYDLVPAALALPLALAAGAVATALAVRWHARAIAGLGIVGAILSAALTGAGLDGGAMAFLAVAVACAAAVVLWRRWNWLALAAFLAATPQWLAYLLHAGTTGAVAVLSVFGALNAVAALGYEVRVPAPRVRASSALLVALNAVVLGVAGYGVVLSSHGRTAGVVWLGALAAAHAVAAAVLAARAPRARDARHVCLVIGVLVADAGVAIATDGPARAIAFAAASVGFAALARRLRAAGDPQAGHGPGLAELGLGGHVGLALVLALAQVDLSALAAPGESGAAGAAVGALAAACLVSGRLAADGRRELRVALDATGLAAVALLAALTFDGAALTAAWAAEAVALARVARRTDDRVADVAALVHLGAAALWALLDQAGPQHLLDGDVALGPAALGVGAVAGAALLVARGFTEPRVRSAVAGAALLVARGSTEPRVRAALHGGAALAALHLASLAAVALAPDGGAALGGAQLGQLQLSTLWALAGVATLLAGLRRDVRALRVAALGLLGVTTAKVFLFDLATLSAGYRVGSFIAVGAVLLLGSFAYARLRPEPLPDLREVPTALR